MFRDLLKFISIISLFTLLIIPQNAYAQNDVINKQYLTGQIPITSQAQKEMISDYLDQFNKPSKTGLIRPDNIQATTIFSEKFGPSLFKDNFNYAVGDTISVVSDSWTHFSGSGYYILASSGSLTYSGYLSSGIGNKIDITSTGSSAEDMYAQFATQGDGTTTYTAFLLNLPDVTGLSANTSTTGNYFAAYLPSTSTSFYNARLSIRLGTAADTYQLGLRAASSNAEAVWYTTDLNINTTYLVVMSYEVITGPTNDVTSVWINPATDGTQPTADLTQICGTDNNDVARFAIRQGGTTTPNASMDGIRIGTSWSEIFPSTIPPAGWTNVDNIATGAVWEFNNPGARTITGSDFDEDFTILDSDHYGFIDNDATLTTPSIDCSALSTVVVGFDQQFRSISGSYGLLEVSNDNATWTRLDSIASAGYPNPAVYTEYDASAVAAGQSTVYFRWTYVGSYSWWWAIDNVVVYEPDATPEPAVLVSPPDGGTGILTTATLNWVAGGGSAPTGYNIYFGTDGGGVTPPTNIENGTDLGNVTTYTPPSALSYSTTYYWEIVPYNGAGPATGNVIWSFTTGPDPTVTVPYTENFDGVTPPALPYGWSVENTNADAYTWLTSSSYSNSPPNSMYIRWNSSLAMDDWFFSPPISLTGGTTYQVTFQYHGSSSFPERLEVLYGDSPSSGGMTGGQIFNDVDFTYSGYTEGTANFTPASSGSYYIGWHGYSLADEYYITVDDISVDVAPAPGLYPPTNLQATVTGQDVDLSWVAPGADQYIRWDNGVNDNSIGLTAGGTFEAAARFPSSMMMPFVGKDLTEVEIYINDVPSSCIIKIYDEGTSSAPGTLLYSEDVTSSIVGTSFNNITLSSPVAINGNDLWISYETTSLIGEHPAGVDPGPVVPDGDWIYISPDWTHLGFNANWNIAGYITTPGPNSMEHTKILANNPSNMKKTGNDIQRQYKVTNLGKLSIAQSSEQVFSSSLNNLISKQLEGSKQTNGVRGIDATLLGYNVYRDASSIATDVATTSYTDPSLAYGFYSYTVTSDYTEGESDPAGPVSVVVPPPPAGIPFTEGFESGDFGNWLVVNGAQTNQWYVGTAAGPHGGTYSAYVSNDGGTTNQYTVTASSVVHFFRDITFTGSVGGGYTLTFWWKGHGESTFDYLRVYLVDPSVVPQAGIQLGSGQIGATYYNLQDTDTMATIQIPDGVTGTTQRLVFSWRNDGSVGTQPPASIDDIDIEVATTGVLNGTVTNCSSTSPVEGATVSAGTYTTTTNGSGFYEFPTIPNGTYDVTVSRLGYADSTATGVVVTAGGTTTQDFCLNETLIPPTNLQATVTNQDVQLTWQAPPNNVLRWDNGNAGNAIGVGGGTFEVSARFDHTLMNSLTGKELREVEIFINDPPDNVTLKIYDQGTPTSPGTLLYSDDVTSSIVAYSWNTITLTTPITLSGNDIWIGYEVTHTGSTYPAGCDAGPMVYPDGQWTYLAPGPWAPLSDLAPSLVYNWNISGLVYNAGPIANSKPIVLNSNSSKDKRSESLNIHANNHSMKSAVNKEKLQAVKISNKASQTARKSRFPKQFAGRGIDATLTGYNVYRDGASIATGVTDLFYNDNGLAYDTYSYTVSAQYTEGESEPAGPVIANVVNPNLITVDLYPQSADYWTGSTTDAAKTQVSIITISSGGGEAAWAKFDVSSIPSGATIQSVSVNWYINSSNCPYFDINALPIDPVTADAATLYPAITGGTIYTEYNSCPLIGWNSVVLGGTANDDLLASVANGWFAVGFHEYETSTLPYTFSADGWFETNPPYLEVTYLTGGGTFPLSVDISDGWNMTSVPGTNPGGMDVSTWWADLTGTVYKFVPGSGYSGITTTTPGEGYWLKNNGTETYSYPSIQVVTHDPINATGGWNMFGGYENSVDPALLTTTPADQIVYPIYKFVPGSGYATATSIDPGYGYWVKVASDCQINVPGAALAKGKIQATNYFKDDWGRITVTDAAGQSYTLYAVKGQVDLNKYELPPLPPAGVFDVRYSDGRIAENINSDFQTIDMSGVKYPVKVTVENMDIRLQDVTGKIVNTNIKSGKEITISNQNVNKLMVSGQLIPDRYALEQNYPNPFNPSTTIEFSLPENVKNVTISIYNVLGQKVAELVNGEMLAGKYQYQWNAKNYASGMYIYELRTEKFVSIKKMMLLK